MITILKPLPAIRFRGWRANNLITQKANTLLLTRAGKLVADQLAMEFFASEK
jgi:coproporphyrinogen III oxidase-like Fe-S oxidoreductase